MKKTLSELENERRLCRAMLNQIFHGPNGEMMKRYVWSVLDLGDIVNEIPTQTYYNLGKRDAIELLINEGEEDER